jgi:hypothetical protein
MLGELGSVGPSPTPGLTPVPSRLSLLPDLALPKPSFKATSWDAPGPRFHPQADLHHGLCRRLQSPFSQLGMG